MAAFLLAVVAAFVPSVRAENEEYAYIGGEIIGFEADVGGALVTSANDFINGEWRVKSIFEPGDLITHINDCVVKRTDDVVEILNCDDFPKNNVAKVKFVRNGAEFEKEVVTAYDSDTNRRVLGVTVKDCVCGLGTTTFVREDGSFAALGHAVVDGDTGWMVEASGGRIVDANISGIVKGKCGMAGTIKGYLCNKNKGMIEKSGKYGINGRILLSGTQMHYSAKLGGRKEVSIGSAKICSCIDGNKRFYDVKIVKAFPQKTKDEKSMIIRVTDKYLIDLTGGIVQGMSGSPIIQNGVIVGAVTHVFTGDPTMGYGIYADWQR